MEYMESTDAAPQMHTVEDMRTQLDAWYAKADTERAWARLREFTTFARKPGENPKISGGGYSE